MARAAIPASDRFAAGVQVAQAISAADQWRTAIGAHSVVPYAANVQWQDTTSNATYCAASTALTP